MNSKAFKAYQATNVTTAKPEKVLLMLYEGCIKFVRLAKTKMVEKKIAEKGKNISKALAIIAELINTLDHEVGGGLVGLRHVLCHLAHAPLGRDVVLTRILMQVAVEQRKQRGFSGAIAAHEADFFAGVEGDRRTLQ